MEQLDRTGTMLCYQDVGKGLPPILFVHDLGCDHRSFLPQIEHFQRSHRVVAVDLSGHGQSDKPQRDYSLSGFADDVAWLCYELGLYRPLVVGHGLGGMIAIETAVRYPELLAGIVALEPMVLPPDVGKILREQFLEALRDPGYRTAMQRFERILLSSGRVRGYFREILEATSLLPQHVSFSIWENSLDWDLAGKLGSCPVPLLYLDAGVSNINLAHVCSMGPHVMVGQTKGTGHFPQMETPVQFNEVIENLSRQLSLPVAIPNADELDAGTP